MLVSPRLIRLASSWGSLCALVSMGCGDLTGSVVGTRGPDGHAKVGGEVVSTVDGVPISTTEVASLAAAGEIAPAEALRKLQSERLLREEARRRGIEPDAKTREMARQALVQALIEEVAAEVHASDADVRSAYEAQKERFSKPEMRSALHVLVRVDENAPPEKDAQARAYAADTVRALSSAADAEAAWEAYVGASAEGLEIIAERIPLFPRDAPLVRSFLDAMFSVADPSVVPEPVRTPFGWHAILVTQIVPELAVPLEEAAETLRPEIRTEKQKAHVDAFVERLRQGTTVTIVPDVGERLAEVGL